MFRFITLLNIQWSKKLWREMFLMGMTALLVVLTSIAIQPFITAFFFERAITSDIDEFVLYVPHYADREDFISNEQERKNQLLEDLTNLPGVEALGRMISGLGKVNDYGFQLYIYNDALVENAKLPLSSGKWFSTHDGTTAVIGGKLAEYYQVGDIITFEAGYFYRNTTMEYITINALVVGILNNRQPAYQFDISGKGSIYTVDAIGTAIQYDESICLITGLDSDLTEEYWGVTNILFVSDDPIQLARQYNDEYSKLGVFVTVDEMTSEYWNAIVGANKFSLVLMLVVFIALLSNFNGFYILTIMQKSKQYGVLFLCGLAHKENVRYCLISGLLISILGIIAGVIITEALPGYMLPVKEPLSYALSGVLLLIVMLISLASSHSEINKQTPIEMLHKGE